MDIIDLQSQKTLASYVFGKKIRRDKFEATCHLRNWFEKVGCYIRLTHDRTFLHEIWLLSSSYPNYDMK